MQSPQAPAGVRPRSGAALSEITALLARQAAGDAVAADRLYALVYDELRRIARGALRAGPPGAALDTTALVHEAYLRLARPDRWSVRDRYHFFALVAQAMRRILVDHARHRLRQKRGGGGAAVTLDGLDLAAPERGADLLALDRALARLEAEDPELGRLVEWRFFAGRSIEEIAGLLGVSDRTVKRHWQAARAYLARELAAEGLAG